MEQEKLIEILQSHKKWLDSKGEEGVRANLSGADLSDDSLRYANLSGADLRGTDLRRADLRGTDLCHADLRDADLSDADLSRADLRGANLRDADLSNANMDYAALPLWCGGLHMYVDNRIGIQMLYHAVANILFSKNTSVWLKKAVSLKTILNVVNKFHRVDECGKLEAYDAQHK